MTLAERLSEYVRACFTGVWIRTFEPDDALTEIARLCRQNGWTLAAWDIDRGLSLAGQTAGVEGGLETGRLELARVRPARDNHPGGRYGVAFSAESPVIGSRTLVRRVMGPSGGAWNGEGAASVDDGSDYGGR